MCWTGFVQGSSRHVYVLSTFLMLLAGLLGEPLALWISSIQFCWVYWTDHGDATLLGCWHCIHWDRDHSPQCRWSKSQQSELEQVVWLNLCISSCRRRCTDNGLWVESNAISADGWPSIQTTLRKIRFFSLKFTLKFNLEQGIAKLHDWRTALINFYNLLHKVDIPDGSLLEDKSGSSTLRLLRLISHNEWTKSYSNIEGNFLIAAMHISCMRELSCSENSYPDIPDVFDAMVTS